MYPGKERIRLLLLDHPPPSRSESYRSTSTHSTISNCPISIISTVWCMTILVITVIFLGFMAVGLVLQKDSERYIDRPILLPSLDSRAIRLRIAEGGGRFNEDGGIMEGLALPLLSNPNNIYFLSMHSLDRAASCSLESVLKKTQRNVFFMYFKTSRKHEYEMTLKTTYPHLTVSKLDEKQFVKETFLDDLFNRQLPSLSIARNYILWQFGGTVITKNLVVSTTTADGLPTVPNGTCLIGPGFISCPMTCSAFVYQLILNSFNGQASDDDRIVRQTVEDFCDFNQNRSGIERLRNICNQPGENCEFILMDNWELNDPDLVGMVQFCPRTYRLTREADDTTGGANVLKLVKGLFGGSNDAQFNQLVTSTKKTE